MVTYNNDIALAKLSGSVQLNAFVNKLCLPKRMPKKGIRCMIAGWGATMEHGTASKTLMKAELPIVESRTCARPEIYGTKITDSMMCAGFARGGIDTCQGDSGGPLHCQMEEDPNIWEVQGIASWGRGCGRQLRYGVYTKVHNFRKWIKCAIKHSRNTSNSLGMDDGSLVCGRQKATDGIISTAFTSPIIPSNTHVRTNQSGAKMGQRTSTVTENNIRRWNSSIMGRTISSDYSSLQGFESVKRTAYLKSNVRVSLTVSISSEPASHIHTSTAAATISEESQSIKVRATMTRMLLTTATTCVANSEIIRRPESLAGLHTTVNSELVTADSPFATTKQIKVSQINANARTSQAGGQAAATTAKTVDPSHTVRVPVRKQSQGHEQTTSIDDILKNTSTAWEFKPCGSSFDIATNSTRFSLEASRSASVNYDVTNTASPNARSKGRKECTISVILLFAAFVITILHMSY